MLMRCVTTYECTVFDDMPIGVEIGDTDLGQQTQTDECGALRHQVWDRGAAWLSWVDGNFIDKSVNIWMVASRNNVLIIYLFRERRH